VERPVGVLAPIGQEGVEADRVDDGAGQDMRPDLRALFHDDDGDVCSRLGRLLLEPDRGRQTCGTCTYDDDVEFHRFTGEQIGHGGLHDVHVHSAACFGP
jgi:hypothetical protein